jgi:hypothetical protein
VEAGWRNDASLAPSRDIERAAVSHRIFRLLKSLNLHVLHWHSRPKISHENGYHSPRTTTLHTHTRETPRTPQCSLRKESPSLLAHSTPKHLGGDYDTISHLQGKGSKGEDNGQSHGHGVDSRDGCGSRGVASGLSWGGTGASSATGRTTGDARGRSVAAGRSNAAAGGSRAAGLGASAAAGASRRGRSRWELLLLRAAEVVAGLSVEVVGDGKLDVVGWVGVTEGVPEDVLLAEQRAADLLPVLASVVDGCVRSAVGLAAVCPAGLGDPDVLAAGDTLGGGKRAAQEVGGVVEGVVALDLVVGEGVDGQEVDVVDDGLVRDVDPGGPGVDVGDLDLGERCVGELGADVLDELHNLLGAVTDTRLVPDTGLGHAVEVLAADRDADDEVGQLGAVLLDGRGERVELTVDARGARRPHTEEELCVGRNGGGEGSDGLGVLLGAGLDVGVQADRVEFARRALEPLCRLELLLKVLLCLRCASVGRGAGIEAHDQVLGNRAANGGRGDREKSCETHICGKICLRE